MTCKICAHEKREEIEQKLLCRSMGDLSITIESVAKEYDLKPIELQVHTLMHPTVPYADPVNTKSGPVTLVEAIKYKEAEALRNVTTEYQATLTALGGKIREVVNAHTDENPMLHKLSRPTVDLYLGLGGEIRGATDSLVRMNTLLNGESDSGLKVLSSLVTAIDASKTK